MTDREALLQIAAAHVRGTHVCEKSHRNGEANPHIHFDDVYIAEGRLISDIARALAAEPPALDVERWINSLTERDGIVWTTKAELRQVFARAYAAEGTE